MKQFILPLVAVAALAACKTDIAQTDVTEDPDVVDDSGDGGVVITDGSMTGAVTLYEAKDGDGGGWATTIQYNEGDNTILVDGLPFDGANTYTVGTVSLSGADIYNGPASVEDPYDSEDITQFLHRALYKQSNTGNTAFGIVRTGEYIGYGFGGFIYMRDVATTLPTSEQAHYTGNYGGMRVYQNQAGLHYVTGRALAIIDFEDFNDGDATSVTIWDRTVWNIDSVGGSASNITGVKSPDGDGTLPDLKLVIAPGSIKSDGSIQNAMVSSVVDPDGGGGLITYESGTFYGLVAGDNAEELVGIVLVEGLDPEFAPEDGTWKESDVTFQETGGFIAYR